MSSRAREDLVLGFSDISPGANSPAALALFPKPGSDIIHYRNEKGLKDVVNGILEETEWINPEVGGA